MRAPRRAIPHSKKAAAHATALVAVIPGRRSRTRNLEIPGSMLRIAQG